MIVIVTHNLFLLSSAANVHLLHTLRNAVIVLLLSNPSVKKTEHFNLNTSAEWDGHKKNASKRRHLNDERRSVVAWLCTPDRALRLRLRLRVRPVLWELGFHTLLPDQSLMSHEGVTAPLRIRSPRHPGYTSRVMFESLTTWSNLLLSVWLSPICGRVRTYWRPI